MFQIEQIPTIQGPINWTQLYNDWILHNELFDLLHEPEEVAGDDEYEADAEDGHVGADHAQAVIHAPMLLTENGVSQQFNF